MKGEASAAISEFTPNVPTKARTAKVTISKIEVKGKRVTPKTHTQDCRGDELLIDHAGGILLRKLPHFAQASGGKVQKFSGWTQFKTLILRGTFISFSGSTASTTAFKFRGTVGDIGPYIDDDFPAPLTVC